MNNGADWIVASYGDAIVKGLWGKRVTVLKKVGVISQWEAGRGLLLTPGTLKVDTSLGQWITI